MNRVDRRKLIVEGSFLAIASAIPALHVQSPRLRKREACDREKTRPTHLHPPHPDRRRHCLLSRRRPPGARACAITPTTPSSFSAQDTSLGNPHRRDRHCRAKISSEKRRLNFDLASNDHGTVYSTTGEGNKLGQSDHDLRHCRHHCRRLRDVSGPSPQLTRHGLPAQTTKKANSNESAFCSYRSSLPGEALQSQRSTESRHAE